MAAQNQDKDRNHNKSTAPNRKIQQKRCHGPSDHPVWQWCLDNAANVHVASDLRYFIDYDPFEQRTQADSVHGVQKAFNTTPVSRGTVQILVECNAQTNLVTLYDVYFVPDSMNVLSQSQAEDQGGGSP